MKGLNLVLQDADPVRHEGHVAPEDLARRRQAILAEASAAEAAGKKGRSKGFALLAIAALIIIAAVFLGSSVRSLFVGEVHAAVRFEVRLAEDRPAPGLREAKISGSDQSVYLYGDVVLTNADIARVEVVQGSSPSQFNVGVELTAMGAQKMRAATSGHIGKRLAVLLDGQVVMAPVIRDTIGSSAVISGNFTKAEAERIANGLR